MPTLLPIGDFSRITYLTVKALRLYHERGLLTPVQVDPSSGYRYYSPDQLPIAQVIRRLRDLGMSLDELTEVVSAERVTDRNRAIVGHLQRLQGRLTQTQASVASLQALLEDSGDVSEFAYRAVPATAPPHLAFVQVPEAKRVKNRVHVDLVAADLSAAVERALELGAARLGDHAGDGYRWSTLADPEGNEFDIVAA